MLCNLSSGNMRREYVLLNTIIILFFLSIINVSGNLNPEHELTFIDELPVEIVGVTVVPHFISGEIPGYGDDVAYNVKGSHIRIFIRNCDSLAGILPQVRFNGLSGPELINSGIVSYCDVPEIRLINKITSEIPPEAVDCYILNVIDSTFYNNGITLSITDTKTDRYTEKQISITPPVFFASRIAFTSSEGSVFPDGFYMYLNNDSQKDITINDVIIWSASSYYSNHYWKVTVSPLGLNWYGSQGRIPSGDINGAYVKTGKLPFGEILVEVDYSSDATNHKMFYAVKPMVINFDFALGWGVTYLANSEAYCKTMKYMHLNTVNGGTEEFFNKKDLYEKYPVKTFSRLQEYSRTSIESVIKRIHGEEHFGEPQFDKKPAQEMYNYYSFFRHSAFPSTLTLSHEPGFNAYAGVVDFNHFDAYRVVAPHADRWGQYDKYGEKNVKWGAPLETIGDYMRTLNRISYPNRVAAWTQAMSNGWNSFSRVAYPNNLEMRIQAYEAVANGATSLYWFTLSGKHLKNHRFNLAEIQQINREIMVVGDMLTKTVPYSWENKFMDMDINVLAGPSFAALFAIDLKYNISKSNQFVSSGPRTETMSFKLPAYLHNCNAAVKVTHNGVTSVDVSILNGSAIITDTYFMTALYILYNSDKENMAGVLTENFNKLIQLENSYGFDPINNDTDWNALVREIDIIDGVVDPTGINENTGLNKNVTIFPNPSSGEIGMKIENAHSDICLQVINNQGNIIQNKLFTRESPGIMEETVNLSCPGIYFFKVLGQGVNYTEKVIIQ